MTESKRTAKWFWTQPVRSDPGASSGHSPRAAVELSRYTAVNRRLAEGRAVLWRHMGDDLGPRTGTHRSNPPG